MRQISSFWAGARRFGVQVDVAAVLRRLNGDLERISAERLVRAGVPAPVAAAWARHDPEWTTGEPITLLDPRYPRALADTPRPTLAAAVEFTATIDPGAARTPRNIYWEALKRQESTPIFDGARLAPGNRIAGPAVVETAQTNVVVPPGRTLTVDRFGNFEMTFAH